MDNDSLLRLTFKLPLTEYDSSEFSKTHVAVKGEGLATVIEVGKYSTGNIVFPDGTEEDLHLIIELSSFRKLEVLR